MILICCDGYDRYAQQAFHLIDVHRATIALHLVHHVQGKHHRYAEFHELHGEIEITLYISRVNNVYDAQGCSVRIALA